MTEFVLVSALGRGQWLASELAQKGWSVTLIDVSDRLQPFLPDELDGPFGLFETPDLVPSFRESLESASGVEDATRGFTLWLHDGPVEMKSAMTAFHLQARQILEPVETHLRRPQFDSRDVDRERRQISKLAFDSSWLSHFAYQVASPFMSESHVAGDGEAIPLFQSMSVVRSTRETLHKGLEACIEAGVNVKSRVGIRDLVFDGRQLTGVTLDGANATTESGRAIVWMLTSAETARVLPSSDAAKTLFPKGSSEPSWYWARFRVAMKGRVLRDQLPVHAVLIDDLYLPWTQTNLLVVKNAALVEDGAPLLDVWMKIPNLSRTDAVIGDRLVKELKEKLTRRFPQSSPEVISRPSEWAPAKGALPGDPATPLRWPLFEPGELAHVKTARGANLFFDGPEFWLTLDLLGRYRHQMGIFAQLEKLKNQWDAAAAKAAQKALQKASQNTGGHTPGSPEP